MKNTISNLSELFQWMKSQTTEWSSSLPLFGPKNIQNPEGVWSWDETHAIVGTCAQDLQIKPYVVVDGKMVIVYT